MNEKEIESLAEKAYSEFNYKVKKPVFMFLDKKEFSKRLGKTKLKKHLSKTPCLVMKMRGGDVIYFCEEIVNGLVKGWKKKSKEDFVKAIVVHELFHVYNNLPVGDRDSAIFSESLVHDELRKEYPLLAKVLDKVEKS
jgi:hypothetical protein